MRFNVSPNSAWLVYPILWTLLISNYACADERVPVDPFAMSTQVFVAKDKKPILLTETLFFNNVVYDRVLNEPKQDNGLAQQVIRFDFGHRVVTILDLKSQKKAKIGFDEIDTFHAATAAVAIEQGGLMGFLAQPGFQNEFDANKRTIRLESPWMTYEAQGNQAPRSLVESYTDFATWSKKLATMLDFSTPAQARIRLNQRLKKQNWQVTRITRTGGPKARELGTVQSQHKYQAELNEKQIDFIRDIERDLKDFEEVSFSQLRSLRKSLRPQ